jgi:hypothetical protein
LSRVRQPLFLRPPNWRRRCPWPNQGRLAFRSPHAIPVVRVQQRTLATRVRRRTRAIHAPQRTPVIPVPQIRVRRKTPAIRAIPARLPVARFPTSALFRACELPRPRTHAILAQPRTRAIPAQPRTRAIPAQPKIPVTLVQRKIRVRQKTPAILATPAARVKSPRFPRPKPRRFTTASLVK